MVRYVDAECPLCEYFGAHPVDAQGWASCTLCNTSWGVGVGKPSGADWLPQPPPIR